MRVLSSKASANLTMLPFLPSIQPVPTTTLFAAGVKVHTNKHMWYIHTHNRKTYPKLGAAPDKTHP